MAKDVKELLKKYESEGYEETDEIEEKPRTVKGEVSTIREIKREKEVKLDLKDRKILYQLELNARQPSSKIAKKVGLSKEVVNYRIKRLESEEVIKGYYALIDLSKLGYLHFRVYLKLIDSSPKKEKEIIDYLVLCKETSHVADIDGSFDIAFGVAVKNILSFESFYNKFKQNFKEYLGKEQISIFTAVYHFNRSYILDEKIRKTSAGIVGKSNEESYDEADLKILEILTKNSRVPLIDVAEKISMPERTVAFRIKKLEQRKIILGYKPLFNLGKLGFEYYKLDIALRSLSKIKRLTNYAEENPFVIYIDQTIAGSDFEIDVEVKNKTHLFQIIEELKSEFSDIREINYFTLISYNKLVYLPDSDF